MKRTLLIVATLGTLGAAAPVDAAPVQLVVMPRVATEIGRTLMTEQLRDALDELLVPRPVLDQLVRWQCGVRDLVHGASVKMMAFADAAGMGVPDLSVLMFEPVAKTESSGFGWRDDPIRHRPKFHSGTDFRGKPGTPVVAAGDGVVVFAGRRGGYGNVVDVDHGGGLVTRYAHLRRIDIDESAAVLAGQRIGQVGATGRATGPHLHFEVRLDGRPVDPVMAMAIAEIARTTPQAARVAAFALTPELQSEMYSKIDPPKAKRAKQDKDARPERRGRTKRVVPVS